MSVYQNPTYYKGPIPELVSVLPKASQTWQAGQFARMTDSGLVLCKSNASSIQYITASTQASATVATTAVNVYKIPSNETQFIMGVTSGGVDTLAPASIIGSNEGLAVNDCIATVSLGNDSTEVLHIEDIYANKSGYRGTDTSDDPGYVIVSIPSAVLTAEGAGL